jgi:hypothetical protein
MCNRLAIFLLAAIAAAGCLAISDHPSRVGEFRGISSAQAWVDRPLYQVPISNGAQRPSSVHCAETIGHGFC